jgi:2-polyprenyl-3-methyl-5-hydroxy-6-metoxy-1,4-benzoquinol methylase
MDTNKPQLESKIDELKPWRYAHNNGTVSISGDPAIAQIEAKFDSRSEVVALIQAVLKERVPSGLRVLDLGCLEGHYTAAIAQMGFSEVVGVDISPAHLQRANFLLGEFHGLKNYQFVQCAATDVERLAALGPFDIVLCHGLLYHLKDPLMMFDVFEAVAPKDRPFAVLLNTQFKGDFRNLVSLYPLAELQVKMPYKTAKKIDGRYIYSTTDQSVFERLSLRLNPAAVYSTLVQYGYTAIAALDSPRGTTYGYSMNLICWKSSVESENLDGWMDQEPLERVGIKAEPWKGRSVDGLHFDKGIWWRLWALYSRITRRLVFSLTTSRLMAARKV